MTRYSAVAYTMQALVKYHGLKDWKLRVPYHDSISANTTSMMTVAEITDERRGGVFIEGKRSDAANLRLEAVVKKLNRRASVLDFRIDSRNIPSGKAKGIGYSSSAGAALTLLCQRLLVERKKRSDEAPEMEELSRTARLFAASAARSLVGGFSRLYAGGDDRTTYARRFADSRIMDLRMVIVPLPSPLKTEDVHRDVLTSPFFEARAKSAQKRCDEMEKAILGNDLRTVGTLAEKDTLELHALTMTGAAGIVIMTEDSLRIVTKVRQLRGDGLDAYFSMQTGPSVFINTSDRDEDKVMKAIQKLGYAAYKSRVGEAAHLLPAGRGSV
jgi:phosphomevalonate decarboxylase